MTSERRKQLIRAGRVLWVALAFCGFVFVGINVWVVIPMFQNPSERITEGLAQAGLSPGAYAGFFFLVTGSVFLVNFIVALLIYLRRPDDGFALLTAIFLVGFGASNSYPQIAEFLKFYLNPPLWYWSAALVCTLTSWPLLCAFMVLYPNGRFVPPWTRVVAVVGFITTTAWALAPALFVTPESPLAPVGAAAAFTLMVGCVYAQSWRYRHYASPLEKQQTKWFVAGLAGFLVITVALLFVPLFPTSTVSTFAASIWDDLFIMAGNLGYAIFPIAIGIGILRYRLWDIDVIIRRTLTYGLVTALLGFIFLGSVIFLQQVFAGLTGSGRNEIVTVLSTLAIAALFVPLRRRIQIVIDRRFNRKKYDAQKVLADFANMVRDETDLEKLTARLMQVVDETMEPKSVSVWLKRETGKQANK
ncbi:MAG: hypothetical protein IT331_05205 [Anaerolineae bacterium]|nr:hypothetical protein [Anaerolineae bacterium]